MFEKHLWKSDIESKDAGHQWVNSLTFAEYYKQNLGRSLKKYKQLHNKEPCKHFGIDTFSPNLLYSFHQKTTHFHTIFKCDQKA